MFYLYRSDGTSQKYRSIETFINDNILLENNRYY